MHYGPVVTVNVPRIAATLERHLLRIFDGHIEDTPARLIDAGRISHHRAGIAAVIYLDSRVSDCVVSNDVNHRAKIKLAHFVSQQSCGGKFGYVCLIEKSVSDSCVYLYRLTGVVTHE